MKTAVKNNITTGQVRASKDGREVIMITSVGKTVQYVTLKSPFKGEVGLVLDSKFLDINKYSEVVRDKTDNDHNFIVQTRSARQLVATGLEQQRFEKKIK